MFERQRVHQAAADAAKKLEDASKEAEETARVAAAQAEQCFLSGSTAAAAVSVPCLLLCAYLSACRRPPETGVSHFLTSFFISVKAQGRG